MLKPSGMQAGWGRGVDVEEIRRMRDLLAAQPAATQTRAPGLHRTLKTLLARRPPSPPSAPFAIPSASDAHGLDVFVLAEGAPCDPIPPELLLGGLAPRRPAFGQRVERVLELQNPAPSAPRRLILCATGGEAVGEIILHTGGGSLHAQAPFFPEDLADEPFPHPMPKSIAAPELEAPPPPPELAATFLLANLAARLASEEADLSRRLKEA